jgi:hypothetical protein
MAFSDTAPIASELGVTKTQAEAYFENMPLLPERTPEPELTKAKYQIVADKKYSGETFSIGGLANEAGLSQSQVKSILRELEVLYGEWNAQNNPIE